MFLVKNRWAGGTHLVFTWQDPRKDGYTGSVVEDVTLDYEGDVHDWHDGQESPEAATGQDPADPKHYKVFKYSRDLQAAGFHPVAGMVRVFDRWSKYPQPPKS